MTRFSKKLMLLFCAGALLMPSVPAGAQYNAFKDPTVSGTTGAASGPDLKADKDIILGGKINVGATASFVVLFKNQGTSPVKVGKVNLYPSSTVTANVSLNQCADAPLTPEAQCAVTVAVTGLQMGAWRVEMVIDHDGRTRIATASIAGDVDTTIIKDEVKDDVEAVPASLDFGTTAGGVPAVKSVIFRNRTSDVVMVKEVKLDAPQNSGFLLRSGCPDKLQPGETCNVAVMWTPVSKGPSQAVLMMKHSAKSGLTQVDMKGALQPATVGNATIYPEFVSNKGLLITDKDKIDFGSTLRNTSTITISLVNAGEADLTLQSILLSGANTNGGLSIVKAGCTVGRVLRPADACPLTVLWNPSKQSAVVDDLQIQHTGTRGILVLPVRGMADPSVVTAAPVSPSAMSMVVRNFSRDTAKADKEKADKELADKEKAAKEQAAKEQAVKEQAAKELAVKEQAAKELAAKEQEAKEQVAKEQAAKEQADKAKAAAEQAAKEQALREQLVKEQADKARTAAEQAAKEQALREQLAKELADKAKVATEQTAKEQALREQLAKELADKAKTAAEQAVKEQALREQLAKELADKAKVAAEQAAKEQANKEKTAAEQAVRDKAIREQADREWEAKVNKTDKERAEREQALREQAAKEQAAKEQADREKTAQEQADKERVAKEQADREQALREQVAKEQTAKEQAAAEQAAREQTLREQLAKEQTAKETALAEQAAKEQALQEQIAKEQAAKEMALAEQAAKEQTDKEKAVKEQTAKEKADKEKAEKEKADKEKAAKEKAAKEKAEKEKAAKEQAAKEKAEKEKAEKERAEKEKAEKEKAEKEQTAKEKEDKEKAEKEQTEKESFEQIMPRPSLEGYGVSSHSATRAVINGDSGSFVVRDGEDVMLAGAKWAVTIVSNGVVLTGEDSEVMLFFDTSLRPTQRTSSGSSAGSSQRMFPTESSTKGSTVPPALPTIDNVNQGR
jgi:hypothetical protein